MALQFGVFPSQSTLLGVLPLLPAAAGLLGALLAGVLGVLSAAATLRPAAIRKLARIVWRQKPALFLIAFVAVVLTRTYTLTAVREISPAVSERFLSARWPIFRGSLMRSGHADQRSGPRLGSVRWSGGRGFVFLSSPAVAGDELIAVGSQGDSARFFCWKAFSGELLWSVAPTGQRATFSSPVVDSGYLICGEGVHSTRKACVRGFKVDADGVLAPAWEFQTKSHVECTPAIDGNRVYFAAGDDGVYCLDRAADAGSRLIWHVSGERYPDVETALAVYEGRVYVGLGRGGNALCVLDALSGNEIARLDMPYPVFSPPAIARGRLYLGLGTADYVNGGEDVPGEVRCLDLTSLETVWKLNTPSPVLAAMVIDNDEVIFAAVAGDLFVVNDDGTVKYRWRAGERILSAPAVTTDTIYCVSCDGILTALDRKLKRSWSARLGAPGLFISSPVVYGGRLFVGTPGDGFVCFGPPAVGRSTNAGESRSGSIRHDKDD